MSRTVKDRWNALCSDFVSADYFMDWYGVECTTDLRELVEQFCVKTERVFVSGNLFNRIVFEYFIANRDYRTLKECAVSVGMSQSSFHEMMLRLKTRKMWTYDSDLYALGLIDGDKVKKILSAFPSVRYHLCPDDQTFCKKLHAACKDDLNLDVEPVYCANDVLFASVGRCDEVHFSSSLDMLTGEPIWSGNALWLHTPDKPISLHADVTSKATYYAHKALLKDRLFPGETVDDE